MLDRLATYKEKTVYQSQNQPQLPNPVLIIAGIVTGILLVKVVPQFEVVFTGSGQPSSIYPNGG